MFVQHDEVPSALPHKFTPSVAFRGARPGAVFTCGPLGLGYYRDVPLAERAPLGPGLGAANVGRQPAVILSLAALVNGEGVTDDTDDRHSAPRRAKRLPKRNRGRRAIDPTWTGPDADALQSCVRFRHAGAWAIDSLTGGNFGATAFLPRSHRG